MSDFFAALELELRGAARRGGHATARLPVGRSAAALAAMASVAIAGLVGALLLSSDPEGPEPPAERPRLLPVGTVIPEGGGEPPRERRSVVVATGGRPLRWQMEVSRSRRLVAPDTGELLQPAGLPCVGLLVPDARPLSFGIGCGRFPRTPGFSRHGRTLRDRQNQVRWLLVYGRMPERATDIRLRLGNEVLFEGHGYEGPPGVRGDFYFFALPRYVSGARVEWLDAAGRPGDRGIAILPP